MEHVRAYTGLNGEAHEPCVKAECHRAFDEMKGDFRAKQDATVKRARELREYKEVKDATAKKWAGNWNNPKYRWSAIRRAARDAEQATELRQAGLEEQKTTFRGSDSRGTSRKRAVNVTVDDAILTHAKEMDLNLSQVLEDELRKRVKDERGRRWQEENKEFIESYNAYIERNGVFGEDLLDLDDPAV